MGHLLLNKTSDVVIFPEETRSPFKHTQFSEVTDGLRKSCTFKSKRVYNLNRWLYFQILVPFKCSVHQLYPMPPVLTQSVLQLFCIVRRCLPQSSNFCLIRAGQVSIQYFAIRGSPSAPANCDPAICVRLPSPLNHLVVCFQCCEFRCFL